VYRGGRAVGPTAPAAPTMTASEGTDVVTRRALGSPPPNPSVPHHDDRGVRVERTHGIASTLRTPVVFRAMNEPEKSKTSPGVGTMLEQSQALSQVRAAASATARGQLLRETGPLAQLQKADRQHFLYEIAAIVKRAKGVVFEGDTLASLQEAPERFGLNFTANLSPTRNDPRADIYLHWGEETVSLQLKTGSPGYIRRSLVKVGARQDGTWLLTQSDIPEGLREAGAMTAVDIDGIAIPSPTLEELEGMTRKDLERLYRGSSTLDHFELTRNAVMLGLVDGLAALVMDLIQQLREDPAKPFDWKRAGGIFARRVATSTAVGILAGSGTGFALSLESAALASATTGWYFRAARVAGVTIPRVFAAYDEYKALRRGEIDTRDFQRHLAHQAGAVAVEWSAFHLAARYAVGLGPIGQFVVLVGGSLLADWIGGGLGEFLFDVFAAPGTTIEVQAVVKNDATRLEEDIRNETQRCRERAEQHRCEKAGCSREHHARGLCSRHYQGWYRRNRPFLVKLENGRLVTRAEKFRIEQGAVAA